MDIPIIWHKVRNADRADSFDPKQVQAIFSAVGINLHFRKGKQIKNNPSKHFKEDFNWLRGRFLRADDRINGVKPARLIFGLTHSSGGRIPGEMTDTKTRGVAAVFTRSRFIHRGGPRALHETAAHEIGHLLNLTERTGFGGSNYPFQYASTMNQAHLRAKIDRAKSWTNARREAKAIRQKGRNPYLDLPQQRPKLYPVSYSNRRYLNENPRADEIRPWGKPYRGRGTPHDLEVNPLLELETRINWSALTVGAPLELETILTNQSSSLIEIDSHFAPELGNLVLIITPPSGKTFRYEPRHMAQLSDGQTLKVGSSLSSRFVVKDSPQGVLFPVPGRYVVQTSVPALAAIASPLFVDVELPSHRSFGDKAFQKFLADGAPITRPRHSKQLDRILARSKRLTPELRAHIALLRARTETDAKRAENLLQIALRPTASPATRNAATEARIHSEGRRERDFEEALSIATEMADNSKDPEIALTAATCVEDLIMGEQEWLNTDGF